MKTQTSVQINAHKKLSICLYHSWHRIQKMTIYNVMLISFYMRTPAHFITNLESFNAHLWLLLLHIPTHLYMQHNLCNKGLLSFKFSVQQQIWMSENFMVGQKFLMEVIVKMEIHLITPNLRQRIFPSTKNCSWNSWIQWQSWYCYSWWWWW